MKPIPRLADDMRIYLATEKMENQEILETLLESREDGEAALMSARQKVSDVFVSYILPAEKQARTRKLDHDGFFARHIFKIYGIDICFHAAPPL